MLQKILLQKGLPYKCNDLAEQQFRQAAGDACAAPSEHEASSIAHVSRYTKLCPKVQLQQLPLLLVVIKTNALVI